MRIVIVTALRINDYSIMDLVLSNNSINPDEIKQINRCRIYLRVETLADITNARGTQVLSSAYLCLPEGRLQSDDLWPYQPQPGPQHRKCWTKFIQQYCKNDSLELLSPLG